jgi:hypothetical protein
MQENNFVESDNKCCEWLDERINAKYTKIEEKKLLQLIKRILQECSKEELEPYRGKYLVFVKNDKNEYQLYDYVFNDPLDVADEVKGAYLFFIPTENKYCNTAVMPYRNAIETKRKCIIS